MKLDAFERLTSGADEARLLDVLCEHRLTREQTDAVLRKIDAVRGAAA